MLNAIFKKKPSQNLNQTQAEWVHEQIMNRIEKSSFYEEFGLIQNLETVLQCYFLYLALVMIVLKHHVKFEAQEKSQIIFDYGFKALEHSFLQNGASDYSIGHKMKKALKFFYGGLAAYEKVILDSDQAGLKEALRKNIYVKQETNETHLNLLAAEVLNQLEKLKQIDWEKAPEWAF